MINGNERTRKNYGKYLFPNYAPLPIIPDRGLGARVWDVEGNEFVDFSGGIAVSGLGHGDLAVAEALRKQAAKLWHVSNYFTTEPALELAKFLVRHTFAEKVMFVNSGAEANETAVKTARRHAFEKYGAGKNQIVAAHDAFHGRTLLTVALGGQPKYREGFGPMPQGIAHAGFNRLEEFEALIDENTCAVIVEPVQGEGGVNEAEPQFLRGLRELCTRRRALLIFDEVQCGNGRTGRFYAYQHYGVTPDILTTAKALGSGFPIGAVLTSDEICSVMKPGTHGTTLGGNPLACAVALATLGEILSPEILGEVQNKRKQILRRVGEINESYPIFSRFTGLGLLIGLRMNPEFQGKAPDFVATALKEKLLSLSAGGNTVRLAPSLSINPSELDEGICYLEMAMTKFHRRFAKKPAV